MIKRIRHTGPVLPRIKNTGEKLKRVEPEVFAQAIGAERVGSVSHFVDEPVPRFPPHQLPRVSVEHSEDIDEMVVHIHQFVAKDGGIQMERGIQILQSLRELLASAVCSDAPKADFVKCLDEIRFKPADDGIRVKLPPSIAAAEAFLAKALVILQKLPANSVKAIEECVTHKINASFCRALVKLFEFSGQDVLTIDFAASTIFFAREAIQHIQKISLMLSGDSFSEEPQKNIDTPSPLLRTTRNPQPEFYGLQEGWPDSSAFAM